MDDPEDTPITAQEAINAIVLSLSEQQEATKAQAEGLALLADSVQNLHNAISSLNERVKRLESNGPRIITP